MLPKRVVFATNVSKLSGAGHFRRLVEISRELPPSFERAFFGSVEIPWVKALLEETFPKVDFNNDHGGNNLIVLDSYDKDFCQQVNSFFSKSTVLQIADRYTPLLPNSLVIFMDLPFLYADSSIESRVIAHGIDYLPTRNMSKKNHEVPDQAKRILVTTGGSVNETVFGQLLAELDKKKYRDLAFEFIGEYKNIPRDVNYFHFHSFGSGFDAIAKDCDTAISASGTTLWDLLASQKIVGLAAIVENQIANYQYATANKQAIGIFSIDSLELDVEALHALLFDTNVRRSIQEEISDEYDFDGAKRFCNLILKAL
jgi:spore coat polysaccharide biosynthesis predicted glycosyltransferase SpsG